MCKWLISAVNVEWGEGITIRLSTNRAIYSLRLMARFRRLALVRGPVVDKPLNHAEDG